ncbi:hypothetical protein Moror_12392 [Moniliophthora roreri MCA 2997]|uniref:Mitochondrial K+-H+ exchange-related-domain-containing protein n=2 Tax=Moniliophthora roreri TaxID=221103 RepID=V2XTC3_MONRO|nr:hypothetical protein Moror_12392 [Moniliophthora roreri MCA 2997]KAI3616321.1 hypothetical protein WG66_013984 [Moniliophthora roreri]
MTSQQSMRSVQRIISLPIIQPRTASKLPFRPADHSKILTYYHFQLQVPERKGIEKSGAASISRWKPEGGWVKWVQDKAAQTWASFGKAPEGSWKLKVFRGGERLVDRIDFEELALKGVDPSLGPTIRHPDLSGKKKDATGNVVKPLIPLLYPPSICSGESTLEHLKTLLSTRAPRHRKGFITWIFVMPLTAPFMIIPIIPNLPFFFCVWRSWSHYRAYRATQYLTALIEKKAIIPEGSAALDEIYQESSQNPLASTPSFPSSSVSSSESNPEDAPSSSTDNTSELLLARDAVPVVVTTFNLEKGAAADILRAVEQAQTRAFSRPS